MLLAGEQPGSPSSLAEEFRDLAEQRMKDINEAHEHLSKPGRARASGMS